MDNKIWWGVAVAAVSLAAGALACNSSSNDPVSACNGYCNHFMSCEGLSGSQVTTACAQSCAEAGSMTLPCGDASASLTKVYNCLEGLPCSDFNPDAGTTAMMNCVTQGCQ